MPKIFYSLNEIDVESVLSDMGLILNKSRFEKLMCYLKDKFTLPWDEYLKLYIQEFLNAGK